MSSPACDAVIEHVPAATIVTVEPLTVQTGVVVEANDTVKPLSELADKLTVPAGVNVVSVGSVNVIA